MSAAHTLLAQALAAYDTADANWKPAEWVESVRACLAVQSEVTGRMAQLSAWKCDGSLLDRLTIVGLKQERELIAAEKRIAELEAMTKAPLSPAWCASVDAELAATEEADAVGMQWPTKSQTLYLEIAHATIAWGEPAKVYAALGAVSLEKITSIEEQFNEMNADEIFNQGEGIYLVSVDWEEAQYEDGRMVFSGYWEIEVIDFQSFDELEKADAATTLPAAAVAEGAQLDGESLEQGE